MNEHNGQLRISPIGQGSDEISTCTVHGRQRTAVSSGLQENEAKRLFKSVSDTDALNGQLR